jgi:hypothetical protein
LHYHQGSKGRSKHEDYRRLDYHPSFQQIAFMDQETGECGEQELKYSDGEAENVYRELKQRGISVRVGMEATGYSRWFEQLPAEVPLLENRFPGIWLLSPENRDLRQLLWHRHRLVQMRTRIAVLGNTNHVDRNLVSAFRFMLLRRRSRSLWRR